MRFKYPTNRFRTAKEAQEFKKKFRSSKEWQQLRQKVYDNQYGLDPITGKKLTKGFILHHLDLHPDYYDNVTLDNTVAVNKSTHKLLHLLFDFGDNVEYAIKLVDKMKCITHK